MGALLLVAFVCVALMPATHTVTHTHTHTPTHTHTHTVGIDDSLLDGMSIVSYQPLGDMGGGDYINSHVVVSGSEMYALNFSPPKLTFGARPLGMPHIERVMITNKLNRTVHLTSISGHTANFHSSFFEDKVIPPNGNTSFNVVFLGRIEGPVDTCLFIHTSEGIHKYMMSGTSTPSSYRLQPLMKIFLPHNTSYSSLVYMHNPHDYPIQITEVYSSGGNVLLELPGGGLEGPQTLWLLPPHTTRSVINVRYYPPPAPPIVPHQLPVRDKESPHHQLSYVRIKLHGTASMLSSVLIVAVEVITSSESGPYAVPQFFDFGLGGTRDPPKKMRLFMGNSSPKPVRISSITIDNADGLSGGGLRILTTARTLLPPFSPPDIHVATLTLHWKQAFDSGQCCGKIIINTKNDQKIEIPYSSEPLNGGLVMNDESVTRYLSSESGITVVRQVLLKNIFKVGVYATELILGKGIDKYFEISAFYPQDFKVNTIQHGFRIQLKSWTKSLKFESKITLVTNISSQVIPVYIYNGKLDILMSIPPRPSNKGILDLGLVGVSSTTRATLVLRNSNPVPVCVRGSGADLPGTAVQLLGCSAQPPTALELGAGSASNVTACTCIPAKWCAVLVVSVVAPASAASLRGEFWVATVHERLIVPVALTAANGGRLSQPEPSTFEDCFPGTLCSFQLQIKSTFPVDMDVVSVEAVPYDRRLFYRKSHNVDIKDLSELASSTIFASALSKIGWLHYDPYLLCDGRCYTGLDLNSTVGQQWLSRITLPIDTLDLDLRILNSRYSLYMNLTSVSSYANMSIRLDTTQVRNHMLTTSIPFIWPKLYKGTSMLLAPLGQVGKPSYFQFKLSNPSFSRPLVVQLLFDWMLPDTDSIKNMPDRLKLAECPNNEWCEASSDKAFYFPDLTVSKSSKNVCSENSKSKEKCNDKISNTKIWHNNDFYWLPSYLMPHPDSRVFMLPPGSEKNITVAFLTNFSKKISTVLYIRNNLTIIEAFRLTGEGVVASLKFGNRKPGSTTPLLFDITEKHLKDCDRDKNKKITTPPNFTVKRTFVARNTGVIPVKISRFFINTIECEGYGFRILNCNSFELSPNATHKVDIAFTPDFTLTKVQRLLILETSLNDFVNYTLVSSIPVSLASKCASILRRPGWEISLHNVTSTLLIGIGFCVLFAGCYESYKILTFMSAIHVRDPNIVHAPFDLRAIGQMGLSKKSETWESCCSNTPETKPKETNQNTTNYKVSNWNYSENVFMNENSKINNVQNQKYEDVSQTTTVRNRKKLGKRNSNASDTTSHELSVDHDLQSKDKKSGKEPVNNSWKNFTRNPVVNVLKTSTKYPSQGSLCDSSETHKPALQDTTIDKHKLPDVPKKLTTMFSSSNDNIDMNSQQNHYNNNKKHSKLKCVSPQSHSCEEDTSSTTTESSNNDDGDKENDNSTSSSSNKSIACNNSKKGGNGTGNKKAKSVSQCKDNYEGDGEDEEYDRKSQTNHISTQHDSTNQRWTKNRENTSNSHNSKTHSDVEKQKSIDQNKNSILNLSDNTNSTKQNKKENSKTSQKRDRQPLSKKRSLDKSFVFVSKSDNSSSLHTTSSFSIARSSPSTPPAVPTVWENRASFSDVVARSDNSYTNNFINHPKDNLDSRKSEPKLNVHSSNVQSQSVSKYSTEDSRKTEPQPKSSSDLGPIGSNYYPKKQTWSETIPENQSPQYGSNLQQMNSHSQNIPDDITSVNNNSYFLNSTMYYGTDYNKSNLNVTNHGSNPQMSYGSIGSSINTVGNNNNIPRMQFPVPGSPILQNINQNQAENNVNLPSDSLNLNSYETGIHHNNYGIRLSPAMGCNMLDLSSGTDLLDLATTNSMSIMNSNNQQISPMETYDPQINPWELGNDSINIMSHMNCMTNVNTENMFDADYNNSQNIYNDKIGWGAPQNLWNPSTAATTAAQNNQILTTNAQVQSTNPANTISSSDCGAAEWLWGYNNTGNNSNTANISNHPQTNVSSNQPCSYNLPQYSQPPQISPPQTMCSFDPYRSLSSIWSSGSSMDMWTSQQNYDGNNQDLNGHGHTNHYQ